VRIVIDEAEAFLVLESFGAADFDFSSQQATFFHSPQQIVFLAFCPSGVMKGARVFVFDNPPVVGQIEKDLLKEILNIEGDSHADELRELASEVIREYLETKSASGYFFDAH
jgi:hypothetical protein